MIGVPEAARRLGSTKSAVRKAIARGTLAAVVKPAGTLAPWESYGIEEAELARYAREHRTPRRKLDNSPSDTVPS